MSGRSARFVSRLTRSTLALILAGGRGSRLKMLTEWRAKPAVPFAGKFRIIDFTLSNCMNSGVHRISVLTQYKSHGLIRHIMQGWNNLSSEHGEFIELIPAQQWLEDEAWYQGTADAVYQSLDIIESHNPEFVLVLAGDHIYKMDYGEMLAVHVGKNADVTVACNRVPLADANQFGVMSVDESRRIMAFMEKPENPTPLPDAPGYVMASMGIYIFSREYLSQQLRREADRADSNHDFGKDIIPRAVDAGHHVQAYPMSADGPGGDFWRDVGTIDSYYTTNLELTQQQPPLDLYDPEWPVYSYQAQLPPAKFTSDGGSRCTMVEAIASGGCVVAQSYIEKSMLFSNVKVDRDCHLNGVLALPDCIIGADCHLNGVILDNGCHVPRGTVIGRDPEEDDKRFYRTEQGVVVVDRAMLGQVRQYQPAAPYDPN